MAFDSTNVTKLPEAPISGDANFDEKADVFLPALVVFSDELDQYRDDLITYVTGQTSGLDTKVANADASATAAANSASTAATKATEATASATSAATKATESSSSAAAALASKNAAAASATSASTSAGSASTSAGTASTKASEASASATLAGTKAAEAASSAGTASNAADTATTKAAEATTSASTAATHSSNASAAATAAAGSATTASTKASEASTSAATATQKALDATNSANYVAGIATALAPHVDNKANPHEVTKTQVGLSNVTNDAQIPKSIGTAKGDLIGFSASGTPVRIPIGTDGKVATADSASPTGIVWKEATGGFKQVFVTGDYTASSLDLVEVNTLAEDSIITLPASGMVEVYDAGGNCAVNNITVKDASNNVLVVLDVNYGDILFRYNTITSSWDAQNLTADGSLVIPTASQEETANLLVSDKYVTPSSLAGFALLFPTHFARSTKFAAKAVSVSADRYVIETPSGYSVNVGGTLFHVDSSEYLDLSLSAAWDSVTTDYRVAANREGRDFYIYSCNYNSTHKFVVSANSTYPAGYTANNSRKIGGFHCLCLSVGTISGHTLSGYLTGDILPASVWDLKHRPVCSPEGMVYVDGLGKWVDIYLASVSGGKLVSAYNATCADGASSPAFHWYKFSQWFGAVGKRMPTQHEFVAASLGSNQGTNIAGSADQGTTGGKSDTAGRRMISNVGCEDCCGNLWQWGEEAGGGASSAAWVNAYDGNDSGVAGQHYQAPNRALWGGGWANGAYCGSRGSNWNNGPLYLNAAYGARGVAEPIENL